MVGGQFSQGTSNFPDASPDIIQYGVKNHFNFSDMSRNKLILIIVGVSHIANHHLKSNRRIDRYDTIMLRFAGGRI
jgi:hypothetical protein